MLDATSTMKAPAGPPIWKRLPPSSDMRNPPTMAAKRPLSGVVPLAVAIAMDKGSATMATVSPATVSARSAARSYPSRRTVTNLGVNSSAKVGAARRGWVLSVIGILSSPKLHPRHVF